MIGASSNVWHNLALLGFHLQSVDCDYFLHYVSIFVGLFFLHLFIFTHCLCCTRVNIHLRDLSIIDIPLKYPSFCSQAFLYSSIYLLNPKGNFANYLTGLFFKSQANIDTDIKDEFLKRCSDVRIDFWGAELIQKSPEDS